MSERPVRSPLQLSDNDRRTIATPVPGEVQRKSPNSSSISALSHPDSTGKKYSTPSPLDESLTLYELARTGMDDQGNPLELEELYDRRRYEEHPGAEDSEDERDLFDFGDDVEAERGKHLAEELAAFVNDADFIPSLKTAEEEDDETPFLPGAPLGWKPPSPPEGWTPPATKTNAGEPKFEDVDNPGGWSEYIFQPIFDVKKKAKVKPYIHHCLPTGATPVPELNGKRSIGGWDFHYAGWTNTNDNIQCRLGSSKEDLFPKSRAGRLSKDILLRLGMSRDRMNDSTLGRPLDALFFYQLLLPICDVKQSGIRDDPRKSFYFDASKFSNLYAILDLNLGNGYGHHYRNTDPAELLRWDGVTVMDGVRGGSDGAMLRRFDSTEGNTAYDKYIAEAFTKTRWLELKRVYKLNSNSAAKKKGEPGYDPAYKFDMIYDVIVSNVNSITDLACLDLTGDETTYAHMGYGEPFSGLVCRIMGKPGVTRGGQIVIVLDSDRLRPRAYIHRHKCHNNEWSLQGPSEVKHIWLKLLPLTEGNENNPLLPTPIFREKPHMTWDNFFSGEVICEYAAEQGFGITTTMRRDRAPKSIPSKHLCLKKTDPKGQRPRMAKWIPPVVATKIVGNSSMMQLTSFQSTSSCNFLSVNAYNECSLYAVKKERGQHQKGTKREWAIEMNDARELYLRTYGQVDRMDHLIKNCKMGYRYVIIH